MKIDKVENQIESNETSEALEELRPVGSSCCKDLYYRLFDSVFPESRVDILSGDLMFYDDKQSRWLSAFSTEVIQYLKTFAFEEELKVSAIQHQFCDVQKQRKQVNQLKTPMLIARLQF